MSPTVSIVATMIAKNPGIERLMKNSSTPSIPPENFVTPCKRNTRPKATLSMTSLHLFMGRDLLTRRDNTYLLVHMFLVFHFIKLQLFSSSVVTKSVICCVFINYKYSAVKKEWLYRSISHSSIRLINMHDRTKLYVQKVYHN